MPAAEPRAYRIVVVKAGAHEPSLMSADSCCFDTLHAPSTGTGRVARFELLPLAELGRPRIDVLCNMSGIFRDSFQNVVELLDDLFQVWSVLRQVAYEPPVYRLRLSSS